MSDLWTKEEQEQAKTLINNYHDNFSILTSPQQRVQELRLIASYCVGNFREILAEVDRLWELLEDDK